MSECSTLSFPSRTIGVDLGDRFSTYTVRDSAGEVCERGRFRTTTDAVVKFFEGENGTRVVYEASTHSPWLTTHLQRLGCETVIANPHRVKLISASHSKCDRKDADLLSEFGFLKPSTLSPIQHRRPEGQAVRAAMRARKVLVEMRTKLINAARGLMKSSGHRADSCSSTAFHRKLKIPSELRVALEPLRDQIESLTGRIQELERHFEQVSQDLYPETALLQQIPGVGPITSLAYVLTIDDPGRFRRSRDVGSYLGLVPKVSQSSDSNPELSITKAGDKDMRQLLVQSAHYILGRFGQDSDLRRHGERIAAGGGKIAKRRAVIAVARKLAVVLHRLWVSGETYDPLRNSVTRARDVA